MLKQVLFNREPVHHGLHHLTLSLKGNLHGTGNLNATESTNHEDQDLVEKRQALSWRDSRFFVSRSIARISKSAGGLPRLYVPACFRCSLL